MRNYNPISANTLLVETLEEEEFRVLREVCLSNAQSKTATDAVIGDNEFSLKVQLITNFKHLDLFWKLNFKESEQNSTSIDGEIIFLEIDNTNEVIQKYDFQKFRYYNKKFNSIISLNNDFFGNVKISYRAIAANAAIANNVLTLHSGCLNIQGKYVALTGDSGAGKSTIFNLLDSTFDGTLIWEDFGFINAENAHLINPNEIFNQIKYRTLETMLPLFKDLENINTEFFDADNSFYAERRLMINFSDVRKTIQNSNVPLPKVLDALVIITNNSELPFSTTKVSAVKALEVFSKPIFSKAHQEQIKYANGSLVLDDKLSQLHNEKFLQLFKAIKHLIILNNNYTPINPNTILDLINAN
jgi:hypothetical protein